MTDQTPDRTPPDNLRLSEAESEQVDSWISERLDQASTTWTESDFAEFERAPMAMRCRVAELQWLHGLLLRTRQGDEPSTAAIIERTLQGLPNQPGEQTRAAILQRIGSRTSAWRRVLLAAVVLFCVGLAWQVLNGTSSAYAAVELALQVAGQYRDRQYAVVAELQSPDGAKRKIVSRLYVRGLHEFVLDHPGVLPGARLWIGSDGREYWMLPVVGPVWLSQENGPLKRWLDQFQVTTPYLQITPILARMQDRYKLQDLGSETLGSTLDDTSPQRFRHIQGTLRDGPNSTAKVPGSMLPARIDVWVHPEAGEVRRLTLDWSAKRRGPIPDLQRVSFDLVNFAQHPDNWYLHEGHHPNNRRVLQIPRGNLPGNDESELSPAT